MPNLSRYFFALVLPLLFVTYSSAQKISSVDYGLEFASHEVTTDHRTSLNLTHGDPIQSSAGLQLKFDISLRRLTNAYGYVFRIIANDSINIDLMSSPDHAEFHDLHVIINNQQTPIQYEYLDVHLKPDQWTHIAIDISAAKNEISLNWNGIEKKCPFPVKTLKHYRLFFGANDFRKFNTSDAPPMAVRDIEVAANKVMVRKWELKEHYGDIVYDTNGEEAAVTKHPSWLIDRHTKWVHQKSFYVGKYPSIAFNNKEGLLYAVDVNGIATLDIKRMTQRNQAYAGGNIVFTDANQVIYVAEKNILMNYDISADVLSTYDTLKKRWSSTGSIYHEPNYWHNNKFYNPWDSALYTFGGYGFFTYKNAFFKHDDLQGKWKPLTVKGSIPPRYLSASGMDASKSKVYLFGGYGSASGKQELSPQSFYDLHTFDLRTHEVKKIWEIDDDEFPEDLVFSNSLVINEIDTCFYVLSFPKNKYENSIKLRRYGLTNSTGSLLADSIPFLFHDENSFADLFLSEPTKELVAVTVHKEKERYRVDVHTINYPPMSAEDVAQKPVATAGMPYAATAAFAIISAGAMFVFWKYRKKTKVVVSPAPHAPAENGHAADGDLFKHFPDEKTVSTINLFGGFQVFDKLGQDITGKFTMTLKELFMLILLYSIKHEKGISTSELHEHLWTDKDEVSARNNRNVNVKKLRTLLDEIGNITIDNSNAYLRLVFPQDVFCDYQLVSRILSSADEKSNDHHAMEILLKYVKRGSLLPNVDMPWLDNFKSDISNKIIDMLVGFSATLNVNKDDRLLLEIADAIFNYDTINQEALVIKCSVLNKKGKYSLAKSWYDHFAKEYKNLYAENYPKTFDDVIS